jgi:hypothetical protein
MVTERLSSEHVGSTMKETAKPEKRGKNEGGKNGQIKTKKSMNCST